MFRRWEGRVGRGRGGYILWKERLHFVGGLGEGYILLGVGRGVIFFVRGLEGNFVREWGGRGGEDCFG